MDQPVISICIPTYNRAKCLKECLSKTLEYDGAEIEIIVSDNASNDGTEKVVASFNDPRVKFFRNEKNVGFCQNFFNALMSARGEWVLWLSDEDSGIKINDWITVVSGLDDNVVVAMGGVKTYSGGQYRQSEFRRFIRGDSAAVAVGFTDLYLSGIFLKRKVALRYCDLQWDIALKGLFPHLTVMLSAVINDGDLVTLGTDVCQMGRTTGKNFMDKPDGNTSKHMNTRLLHFKIYSKVAIANIKNDYLISETVSNAWLYQARRSVQWAQREGFNSRDVLGNFHHKSMQFLAQQTTHRKLLLDELSLIIDEKRAWLLDSSKLSSRKVVKLALLRFVRRVCLRVSC